MKGTLSYYFLKIETQQTFYPVVSYSKFGYRRHFVSLWWGTVRQGVGYSETLVGNSKKNISYCSHSLPALWFSFYVIGTGILFLVAI